MSEQTSAPKSAKGGAIPQRSDMSPLGTAGSNGEDSSPAAIRASISASELAEMEVDTARGDLKAFDGIRLLAEVRGLRAVLDVYNDKLRLLRAKYGLDVLAGDVERLYEAHEKSEADLGILRLKVGR